MSANLFAPRAQLRLARLLAIVLLLALGTGCGSRDERRARASSVLDAGVAFGPSPHRHRISPEQALNDARHGRTSWERQLRTRAAEAPAQRFWNLPVAILRRRLTEAAHRNRFEIITVKLLRPRQLAPLIVVRTRHYVALARTTRAILKRLDPKVRTGDDSTGWRYEGFFFEAEDERGVPFLFVDNFWRGADGGGGEFARSEPLFPFAHA